MPEAPQVTVVIPVYNEEAILQAAVIDLRDRLRDVDYTYEIILAENGSRDRTVAIGRELSERFKDADNGKLRLLSVGEPNYGRALRQGILEARGEFVICEEIDLCDVDFHARALQALRAGDAELVIGSKLAPGSADERPLFRHAASLAYSALLRALLGFRGTDTHGLKAFRRETLLPVVRACVIEKDVFASELVIRADRQGVRTLELPVRVMEKRPPSINLLKRVPNVCKNLAKLTYAVRVRG